MQKTIKDILELSSKYLSEKGVEAPRRQAEDLVGYVLGLKRIELYMDIHRPLNHSELESCRTFLRRRGLGEPLAYIAGYLEFYHCKINVDRNVLIPRQETEILLDLICKDRQKINEQNVGLIAWDICCGSGCMGIGFKKKFPEISVFASDISPGALQIAGINAANNQVEITFLEGSLLEPYSGMKADVVMCNPPYISEKDYCALDVEVKNFEPKIALLAGETGLEYYQQLSRSLPDFLNPGAKVWFEIGWDQGKAIQELFKGSLWISPHLQQDWSGHDRFFSVIRK